MRQGGRGGLDLDHRMARQADLEAALANRRLGLAGPSDQGRQRRVGGALDEAAARQQGEAVTEQGLGGLVGRDQVAHRREHQGGRGTLLEGRGAQGLDLHVGQAGGLERHSASSGRGRGGGNA